MDNLNLRINLTLILAVLSWKHHTTLHHIRLKLFFLMKLLKLLCLNGRREIPWQRLSQRIRFLPLSTLIKNTTLHWNSGSLTSQSSCCLREDRIFIWFLLVATKLPFQVALHWTPIRCVIFVATWSLSPRIGSNASKISWTNFGSIASIMNGIHQSIQTLLQLLPSNFSILAYWILKTMSAHGVTMRAVNSSILSPLNSSNISGLSSMERVNTNKLIHC